MSLWTLVDGRAGEFVAHWTLQVRLHLLVVVLTVVVVVVLMVMLMVVLVVVLMVLVVVVLMVMLMVVLVVVQTNLTPFILWQTVKTLLSRLLSSTPDLTFTVSGQE